MSFRSTYVEGRRVFRQYSSAVHSDAGGRLSCVPHSAYRILLARACHGVGPVYYSLFRFSQVPMEDWGNYITDDPAFKQFLFDRNPKSYRFIADNKLAFHGHCMRHGLPTIPVLCAVSKDADCEVNGVARVSGIDEWRSAMAVAPAELFVKTVDGTYGEGALTVQGSGDRYAYANHTGSLDDLYHYLNANRVGGRDWLVQPRARSDLSLAGIVAPKGLATVRAVTHIRAGRAELLVAALKITVGDSITDNFSKGASGNLLAGIELQSGILGSAWGSVSGAWPKIVAFPTHPDTGQRIEGLVLPWWKDVVNLALRAQESLPQMRTLGWDIAATTEGVKLVEVNAAYDMSILQVAHQRGMKREFFKVLN